MNKIFIVKYYGGSHDDWYEVTLFVTSKKSTATKYITKFNKTLKKWKEYYKKYEEQSYGNTRVKDEHLQYFDRWLTLNRITKCYWKEVEVR